MVILHDAVKTIQNWVFVFFLRTKTCFFFKKTENTRIKKKQKTDELFFLKKLRFFSNLVIFQYFVIFP